MAAHEVRSHLAKLMPNVASSNVSMNYAHGGAIEVWKLGTLEVPLKAGHSPSEVAEAIAEALKDNGSPNG